mmetsp:Transcript_3427/g.8639  ORF Transcript_3427/g.8639 Transcript_3427/m.8639 type:complete len:186 (+) Transcript_3427:58-615(+)
MPTFPSRARPGDGSGAATDPGAGEGRKKKTWFEKLHEQVEAKKKLDRAEQIAEAKDRAAVLKEMCKHQEEKTARSQSGVAAAQPRPLQDASAGAVPESEAEARQRRWLGAQGGAYIVGTSPVGVGKGWAVLQVDSRTKDGDTFLRDFLEAQIQMPAGLPPDPEVFAAAVRAHLGMPPLVQRSPPA